MILFCIIAILVFFIMVGIAILREWFLFAFIGSGVIFVVTAIIALLGWFSKSDNGAVLALGSGIVALIALGHMLKALFRSKCPACKKFFKARRTAKNMIQTGDIFYEGSGDNRTAYQKNLYQLEYSCIACQHEWSRNVTEKERAE
jgi:hypothetical protein